MLAREKLVAFVARSVSGGDQTKSPAASTRVPRIGSLPKARLCAEMTSPAATGETRISEANAHRARL